MTFDELVSAFRLIKADLNYREALPLDTLWCVWEPAPGMLCAWQPVYGSGVVLWCTDSHQLREWPGYAAELLPDLPATVAFAHCGRARNQEGLSSSARFMLIPLASAA